MYVVKKKTTRSAGYYLVRSRRDGKRVSQETVCYLGPANSSCDTLDGAIRYYDGLVAAAKQRIAKVAAARDKALAAYREILRKEIAETEREIAEARRAGGGAGWLPRLQGSLAESKRRLRGEPFKPGDGNRIQTWWRGPRGQVCLDYWQHDEDLKRATRALVVAEARGEKLKAILIREKELETIREASAARIRKLKARRGG